MKSKKTFLALAVVFCMIAALIPTTFPSRATTITMQSNGDLRTTVANATNGTIIDLNGSSFMVNDDASDSSPWAITKSVTIQNGTISLRSGGIVLGANVEFKDIQFEFPNPIRNVIAANGYKLTLNNSTRAKNLNGSFSAYPVHIVCGSMMSTSGVVGSVQIPLSDFGSTVSITGTDVHLGNIYAGHIYTDDTSITTSCDLSADITINVSGNSTIGQNYSGTYSNTQLNVSDGIYASGALEFTVNRDEMLNPDYVLGPPIPFNALVTNNTVTINLNSGIVNNIDGATGGSTNANVVYSGADTLVNNVTFKNLASLSVASGKLAPSSSSDLSATSISLTSPARLGFTNLSNSITTGGFTFTGNEATVVLGKSQTLTIGGPVTGTAKVSIGAGSYDSNASSEEPTINTQRYIYSTASADTTFSLWPYAGNANIALVKSGSNWIAQSTGTPAPATYSVTATSAPTAGGTVSGAGSGLAQNASVTLTANANTGYTFKNWTSNDITISSTDATNSSLTFSMPASNVAVTANFEQTTTPSSSSTTPSSSSTTPSSSSTTPSSSSTTPSSSSTTPSSSSTTPSSSSTTPSSSSTTPSSGSTTPSSSSTTPNSSSTTPSSSSTTPSGSTTPTSATAPTNSAVPTGTTNPTTSTQPQKNQAKIQTQELKEVPATLRNTYKNVDELKSALLKYVDAQTGYTRNNTIFLDVSMQISNDTGKTWTAATSDNFPASGITVKLPYPTGTGRTTHDFFVTHMFTETSSKLGTKAGEVEHPAVTKLEDGIQVTFKGLSPVSISWKPASTTAPKTSDNNYIWLLSAIIGINVTGIGFGIYIKKKHSC